MISAQVKAISTWEGDHLELDVPEDAQKFCVLVRVMVGPRGGEGEESFDINVCTPQWLEEQVEREKSKGLFEAKLESLKGPNGEPIHNRKWDAETARFFFRRC